MRTSKHPLSACVCGCLRTFEPLWADVCGCLRTRPKCLGMTCRCVCECLRPRKTAALHAVTCLRMSAEGETKEFLLLTDVCGLGDQNHPEARSKTVGFRFLCISCRGANIATFPDGEIHSKMEMPTGPQTNPACIKTDAHRTNAFAT